MALDLQSVPDLDAILTDLYREGPIAAMRELKRLKAVGESAGKAPFLDDRPELPISLEFASRVALDLDPQAGDGALDSLPFYSLCRGLYLPLLGWAPQRERAAFGTETPHAGAAREALLLRFFERAEIGLSTLEKTMFFLADPFRDRAPAISEEVILGLLAAQSGRLMPELRRDLVRSGGLPLLAAELVSHERSTPPLSSREVILCLSELFRLKPARRRAVVADLLKRCGRLERFCLCGLLLGKLHLAWSQRTGALVTLLAERWGVAREDLETASGLRDLFSLVTLVETEGPAGLRKIVLQPLIPFRPALAQSLGDGLRFPAWAECKYDGIRLLLHKQLDPTGRVQGAAYTRKRHDWSELIPGLPQLLQFLPARSVILDGELHGSTLSEQGVPRPATVYEVHQRIRGEGFVNLRYVVFDILYIDGQDVTSKPFEERRALLERLVAPLQALPMALPLQLSQGGRVDNQEQMAKLYNQYRRQGHEGLMIKILDAGYGLNQRTPAWLKKKPALTLELALTGAFWGEKHGQRVFDSYTVSCLHDDKLEIVGTVAGVDQLQTQQIVAEISRQQLFTARTLEHRGNERVASGVELSPYIVVSVTFEAVIKDSTTEEISLRGPRITALRSGEISVREVARWADLEKLALRDRLA